MLGVLDDEAAEMDQNPERTSQDNWLMLQFGVAETGHELVEVRATMTPEGSLAGAPTSR